MIKILMINQPLLNRGDESAHRALIRTLLKKAPHVRVTVLWVGAKDSDIEEFIVDDPRVSYMNVDSFKAFNKFGVFCFEHHMQRLWYLHPTLRKIISIYNKHDLVLNAPGGICLGGFQNWNHLLMLEIAKYLNKPIAYYGRSIGPFPEDTDKQRKFRMYALQILGYMSFKAFRDKKSEELADNFNLNYVSTVDSAFLESPKVMIPQEISSKIGDAKYMVFVPNLLIWHFLFKGKLSKDDILSFYSKMIDVIFKHNSQIKIVMLPQTYGYGIKNDVNFFRDIERIKKDDRIVVLDDCYGSDIQQTLIGSAEYVIGARYHSIVFALNQGVPFVALSYEHKMYGLLQSLGKEDCLIDLSKNLLVNDGISQTLHKIENLLNEIHPDKKTQEKAMSIAQSCLDKFIVAISK